MLRRSVPEQVRTLCPVGQALAFWGLSAVGGMIIMSAQLTQSLPPERLNVYALMLLSLALSLFLCAMLATLIGDDLIRLIPGIERFVVSPRDRILRFPIFVMGGLYSLIAWETLNGLDRAIFQLGWTTLAKLGMLAVLLTAPGVALVLTAIFGSLRVGVGIGSGGEPQIPLSRMRGYDSGSWTT